MNAYREPSIEAERDALRTEVETLREKLASFSKKKPLRASHRIARALVAVTPIPVLVGAIYPHVSASVAMGMLSACAVAAVAMLFHMAGEAGM